MKQYPSHKRTNELDPQPVFAENLNIPVVEPISGDTRFITANKLGNCLVEFQLGADTPWVKTFVSPISVSAIRFSGDGGQSWKILNVGSDGVNAGIKIIYSAFTWSTITDAYDNLPQKPQYVTATVNGVPVTTVQWFDNTSGKWYDTPDERIAIWMAISVYNGSVWGDWVITRLRGNEGEEFEGGSPFTAFIFKAAASKPASPGTIGTYDDPQPAAELNALGWYDEPPTTGTLFLWMSQRTYYFDNSQAAWSSPVMIEGSANLYSVWSSEITKPAAPAQLPYTGSDGNPAWNRSGDEPWYDNPDDAPQGTSMWWAYSILSKGVWQPWQIVKVYQEGAKGDKGDNGQSLVWDIIIPPGGSIEDYLDEVAYPVGTVALAPDGTGVYIRNTNGWSSLIPYGAGPSGITVVLDNEAHVIACDAEGVPLPGEVGEGSPAITKVLVFSGSEQLTAVAGPAVGPGEFAVHDLNVQGCLVNCTASMVGYDQIRIDSVPAGATSAQCHLTIFADPINSDAKTIGKTFSISKAKMVAGVDASRSVKISSNGTVFRKDKFGNILPGTPSIIRLTPIATGFNLPNTTYSWFRLDQALTEWTEDLNYEFVTNGPFYDVSYSTFVGQTEAFKVVADDTVGTARDYITLSVVQDAQDGYSAEIQYSTDGVTWSDTYISGSHKYYRQSTDGGQTWTTSIPLYLPGEKGEDALQLKFIYARSPIPPETPYGNFPESKPYTLWSTDPGSLDEGDGPLYMSSNYVRIDSGYPANVNGWTTPVKISGPDGESSESNEIQNTQWINGDLYGVKGDGSQVYLMGANDFYLNWIKNNNNPNMNTNIFSVEDGLGSSIGVDPQTMTNAPTGLYITKTPQARSIGYIGFWDATGKRYTSYMDSSGRFSFQNRMGTTGMQWDPDAFRFTIGQFTSGKGMQYDGVAGTLRLVGAKIETSDADTKIVLDPADNSMAIFGVGGQRVVDIRQIFTTKAIPGLAGATEVTGVFGKISSETCEFQSMLSKVLVISGGMDSPYRSLLTHNVFTMWRSYGGQYLQLHFGQSESKLSSTQELSIFSDNRVTIRGANSASLYADNGNGAVCSVTTGNYTGIGAGGFIRFSLTGENTGIEMFDGSTIRHGASGSFTSADGKTVTVTNGIITGIA